MGCESAYYPEQDPRCDCFGCFERRLDRPNGCKQDLQQAGDDYCAPLRGKTGVPQMTTGPKSTTTKSQASEPTLKPCPFCGSPTPQVRDQPDGVYIDCYRKGCSVEVLTDCETVEEAIKSWNARVSANGVPTVDRAIYSELIHIAAELARGDGFLSTCAEDLNPRLKRAGILKTAERQEERLKDWAYRVRQVADKLRAAASPVAPQQSDELAPWTSVDNWPLPDVLTKLADATDTLLTFYNYDGDGWEELKYAALAARTHITLLTTAPAPSAAIQDEAVSVNVDVDEHGEIVFGHTTPSSTHARAAARAIASALERDEVPHHVEESEPFIAAIIERCLSEGEALTLDEVQE